MPNRASQNRGGAQIVMGGGAVIEPTQNIRQFFEVEETSPEIKPLAKPFHDLSELIISTLPNNPERLMALRKLLESRDAALRARRAK